MIIFVSNSQLFGNITLFFKTLYMLRVRLVSKSKKLLTALNVRMCVMLSIFNRLDQTCVKTGIPVDLLIFFP